MARPTVIRDQQILDAAQAVFLERGALATTAEVAQRAGVSEGSLFKRFKTKAELFQAAMGLDLEEVPRTTEELGTWVGQRTVEENLVEAARELIKFFDRAMPLMMMTWSNPKMAGECRMPGYEDSVPPPLRAQAHVAAYLEAERELGRVGELDAEVVARAFLGAMSSYVFYEKLARGSEAWLVDSDRYARGYVRTLVAGLEPRSARARAVARKPSARASSAGVAPLHALSDRA